MSLTRMEKVELALIVVVIGGLSAWPVTRSAAFGTVVGAGAALLLGQGLVRDLARLAVDRARRGNQERLLCLCAESTVGAGLIVVALSATALGIVQRVSLDHTELVCLVAALLGGGFIAKDYVVTVRKETDHGRINVL